MSSSRVRFMEFVNKSVGKELTTGVIASKTGVHVRQVQSFCKSVRGRKGIKSMKKGTSIVYLFSRPLKETEVK